MAIFPVPHLMKKSIYDLTPEAIQSLGVDFLLLDVDNTIAPYGENEAGQELISWVNSIRDSGIKLFILSNNRGNRPEIFASALGIGCRGKAWKPFPGVLKEVLAEHGIAPARAAVLGDQIYTDALCAAWSGAKAIVVHPICLKNPLLALRYGLEAPFRFIYALRKSHE